MRKRGFPARLTGMILALALLLAPMIFASTHGPGALALAATEATEVALHGHSHDDDSGTRSGHNASDHEHQVVAILPMALKAPFPNQEGSLSWARSDARGTTPDLPRRPPRA